jgi:hypothetical protein
MIHNCCAFGTADLQQSLPHWFRLQVWSGRGDGGGSNGGGSGTLTVPIYGPVHSGGVGLRSGSGAGLGLILGAGGGREAGFTVNDHIPEKTLEKLEAPGRKSSVIVLSPLGVPCWELPVRSGFAYSTARHLLGYKTEAKANGLRGDLPCAMGPLPATDRLEAKQLRVRLLSKRVVIRRKKAKSHGPVPQAPRPKYFRLEAKQLRMCLLSKRVEILR